MPAFIGGQVFDLALDLVELGDVVQRLSSNLALVVCMQLEEVAPSVRLMWSST